MRFSIPLLIAVILLGVSVVVAVVDHSFPAILFAVWAAEALYIGGAIGKG